MYKLGVDLGRSEIRLYDGTLAITLPTLLGGPVSVVRRGGLTLSGEELERNIQITMDGETYSLGKLALNQPFLLPVGTQDFASDLNRILLLGALGLYGYRQEVQSLDLQLCIGIPVSLTQHEASIQAIQQWQGTHRFELSGNTFEITIHQITLVPQPMGSLYSALLNGQLDYDPEAHVGVLDLGYAGTGWMVSQLPGELAQYSGFSPNLAGSRLVEQVSQELLQQGIPQVNPLAALQAIETGTYRQGGQSYEIDAKAQENILNLMAQQIALTLRQRWQDLSMDTILVTGGLGAKLFPKLQKYPYFSNATLVESPRLANVLGYSEYLTALDETEEAEITNPVMELNSTIEAAKTELPETLERAEAIPEADVEV